MKQITAKYIRTFRPCEDGINDFEYKYPKFKGSLSKLLQLQDITYENKLWLITKVVDIEILQQWSVNCAEMVVDNYNKVYPKDTRITDCINTTKKYLLGECSLEELNTARAAAWSARSAARSAAESAAESAWSAARSARSTRSAAWSAEKEQEDLNLSLLIALLQEV